MARLTDCRVFEALRTTTPFYAVEKGTNVGAWTVLEFNCYRGRSSWNDQPAPATATATMVTRSGTKHTFGEAGLFEIQANMANASGTGINRYRRTGELTPVRQSWNPRTGECRAELQGRMARLAQAIPTAAVAHPYGSLSERLNAISAYEPFPVFVDMLPTSRTGMGVRAESSASSEDALSRLRALGSAFFFEVWERRDRIQARAIDWTGEEDIDIPTSVCSWVGDWTQDLSGSSTDLITFVGDPRTEYSTLSDSNRRSAFGNHVVEWDATAHQYPANTVAIRDAMFQLMDPSVWEPPQLRIDMLGLYQYQLENPWWPVFDLANQGLDPGRWITLYGNPALTLVNPPPFKYAKQTNAATEDPQRFFIEGMREVLDRDSWTITLDLSHSARYKLTPN